jgi:hypothetical protein
MKAVSPQEVRVAIYTFYPCKRDGGSEVFEVYDLPSDDPVEQVARVVLKEHASCAYVAVWAGERRVATFSREDGCVFPS